MIKRTPQEVADFFQVYVAKEKNGEWRLYTDKPHIDNGYGLWVDEERTFKYAPFISNSLISDEDDVDWQESLCEPRMINGTSDGESDIKRLIRMLLNMILMNTEYTEDLKQIADHYGKRKLLERLIVECAEMTTAVVNYPISDNKHEFFKEVLASLEILLEQIKYLLKIDPVELGGIKKERIAIQQLVIARESHKESADNPRKVHEKSANEEEEK